MNFIHNFMLALLGVLIISYAFLTGNPYGFLMVSTVLSFGFILKSKLDITNPDIWFVIGVNVYHLSIFILDYLGLQVVENKFELTLINFLALLGYFTASTILHEKKPHHKSILDDVRISKSAIKLIVWFLVGLTLVVPISFIASGASHKADFNNQFASFYSIFNYAFMLLIIKSDINKSLYFSILFVIIYLFTSSLLLGERDVFFSFMLSFLFLASRRLILSRTKLIIACVCLVIIIPILGEFKNIFTRDSSSGIEKVPLVISLLNGEFRSAGYNINHILSQKIELKYGESLVHDSIRSVVPRFIYPVENSVSWYNNTFHPDIVAKGRGYGFSLAAEGFVNFGFFGVYLWFLLIGIGIVTLYNKSFSSTFYLSVYLSLVPIFIYVLRGDFSTVLSPLVKQIIIPYMLMFLFFRFLRSFQRVL